MKILLKFLRGHETNLNIELRSAMCEIHTDIFVLFWLYQKLWTFLFQGKKHLSTPDWKHIGIILISLKVSKLKQIQSTWNVTVFWEKQPSDGFTDVGETLTAEVYCETKLRCAIQTWQCECRWQELF